MKDAIAALSALAQETRLEVFRQLMRALPEGNAAGDLAAELGVPRLDFVFTVCDNAANEVCPIWPGQPMTAH